MLRSAGIGQSVADTLYEPLHVVLPFTPTTGQTISFQNSRSNQTIFLTPAGSLAALTITFPSEATSRVGQILSIATSQAIIVLTLNGAITIMNTITSLTASDHFSFKKVAANTWVKEE